MQTGKTSRCIFTLLRHGSRLIPKEPRHYSVPLGAVRLSTAVNISEDSTGISSVADKWQIVGAACITRMPVVCPPMTPMEEEFSKMLDKIEEEVSLKSDHELRHEQDLIRAQLLKNNEEMDDVNLDETSSQTALEFEDTCAEELRANAFAPKTTEADEKGDYRTFNHHLDRSLVLVVNQKLGSNHQWVFPQSPWIPGETLRQTCERVVQEKCGSNLRIRILGNAPCGFYKYKYPKAMRSEGYIGAKVFFYKAQVRDLSGTVHPGSDISEYLWLPLEQLDSKLKAAYAKSVAQFLVSDK